MASTEVESLGRACRVVLGLFVVLILLEVGLRNFVISPAYYQRDELLGLRGRAYARVLQTEEGRIRSRLNSLGLPDTEPWLDPRARILVAGDSFTEAFHVPAEANYTSVAERALEGVEFVNAGFAGRSPVQALAAARQIIGQIDCDALVLQVSGRDVGEMMAPGRLHLEPRDDGSFEMVAPAAYGRSSQLSKLRQWLIARSALANLLLSRAQFLMLAERSRLDAKFRPAAALDSEAEGDPEPATELAAAKWLMQTARATGLRVYLLYLPTLDFRTEEARLRKVARRQFWVEVAEESGVTLVDPTPALRRDFQTSGEAGFGFDNEVQAGGHLNRRGHRVVGTELAGAIAPDLP